MNNLNYRFFEEFKKLDRICKEIYESEIGITNYINDMKSVPLNEYLQVKEFKTDLHNLIRFRHIRNYLAHSEGGFSEEICTQNDIETIKQFYCRILERNDPMAIIYKNKSQAKKVPKNVYTVVLNPTIKKSSSSDFHKNCVYWIVAIIIITLLFIIIPNIPI